MELETVRCILGDRRAAFQAWYPEHVKRERSRPAARGDGAPSAADMRAEIESRTKAAEKLKALVSAHRRAVACALSGQVETPGRLPPESLDAIETAIASHREVLAYLAQQVTPNDD